MIARPTVVIDDHLLLRVLLDDEPASLRPPDTQLFTTGLWYHRLCRAVSTSTVLGSLSRMLGDADPATSGVAIRAVMELPDSVGLMSMRELAWPMAALLDDGVRLNVMSLEALSAAMELGAELCLASADANPTLLAAANAQGVPVRLIGL